jgi:hypothetical protein
MSKNMKIKSPASLKTQNIALAAPKTEWRTAFYNLCFADDSQRWQSDIAILIAVFLYAAVNAEFFDADDTHILRGMLALILISKVVYAVAYCLRKPNVRAAKESTPSRWLLGIPTLTIRLSGPILIIAGFLIFLPSQIKTHVFAAVLSKTSVGLLPGVNSQVPRPLAARFESEANTLQRLMADKQPGDPVALRKVRDRLQQVVQNVNLPLEARNNAINEIANLHGYELFNVIYGSVQPTVVTGQGKDVRLIGIGTADPAFSVGRPFILEDNFIYSAIPSNKPVAIMQQDLSVPMLVLRTTMEGITQKLDGITWIDVSFKNSVIIYDGGPTYMSNVTFVDCTFQMSPSPLLNYFQTNGQSGISFYRPYPPRDLEAHAR